MVLKGYLFEENFDAVLEISDNNMSCLSPATFEIPI